MSKRGVKDYFWFVYDHATGNDYRAVAALSFETSMEYWLGSRLIVHPGWSDMDPARVPIECILPNFCFFGIPWFSCD